MDKTLLSQLRAKHPDAVTGAACRTATFINPYKMVLGHREWLEANRIAGQGWAVRHMVLKPAVIEGEADKIAQTYLAGSNKPGQGMAFIDALLKLHEYEMAQPLLGYLSDPDDAGAVTGATHYRSVAEAEGIAFKGADIVLSQSGIIAQDGEFDVATIRAVFDAANKTPVKKAAANYQRDMRLPIYGDLSVCSWPLQQSMIFGVNRIIRLLKDHGSRDVLNDCSGPFSPFYKPHFAVFEKGLKKELDEMRDMIDGSKKQGRRFDLCIHRELKRAVNFVEFHALRLSVAWMQEEIRNHPPYGDKARVRKDMNRAIARCAEILNQEEIPGHKHDELLDFDFSRASCSTAKDDGCEIVDLGVIIQWLGALVRRPQPPLAPPRPRPSPN